MRLGLWMIWVCFLICVLFALWVGYCSFDCDVGCWLCFYCVVFFILVMWFAGGLLCRFGFDVVASLL